MPSTKLDQYFAKARATFETAYTAHSEPWRQSGMSGPEERWISLRKPVADCIDRSGTVLDIGCANGYLLECLLRWTAERGLAIKPFGLDIAPGLVELARARLPEHAHHFYVGNAWDWVPPQRFDFVRTELVYVPAAYERAYLERLARVFLNPGGKLIVPNYVEGHPHPETTVLPENHATADLLEHLAGLNIFPLAVKDGYDPIKDRRVRVAILNADNILRR